MMQNDMAFALIERKCPGKQVREYTEGAAPEKSGRTGRRGQEAQLAYDEPEVDGVADQLGSALHT